MSSENDTIGMEKRGRPKSIRTRSYIEPGPLELDGVPKTPSRKTVAAPLPRTPLSGIKHLEGALTPSRRSARKSVMPAQDYDEIVQSKHALSTHNAEKGNNQNEELKWTPAKVGRVSQKRSTRKGRSAKKLKVEKSVEESDKTVRSSEDSEGKSDESKYVKATEENTNDILNTTFDKDTEEYLDLENVQTADGKSSDKTVHAKDAGKSKDDELMEMEKAAEETTTDMLNSTFDKSTEENVELKNVQIAAKEVLCVEDAAIDAENSNETVPKAEDSEDKYNESKEMDKAAEENTKDMLNTTFDKDNEENLDADDVVKATEAEVVPVDPAIIKIMKEGNELGCTPILYDDNSETGGSTPISKSETFEKQPTQSANIEIEVQVEAITDEVSKESKKDDTIKKTEKSSQSTNNSEATIYESIDLASDDEMGSLILSDDEENRGDKNAANDTFNMSDCIIVSPTQASVSGVQPREKESQQMEKEKPLSAGEKGVKNRATLKATKSAPKIVLTNEKNMPEVLLSTPQTVKKRPNLGTPVSAVKRRNVETPISTNKRPLVGTPSSAAKRQLVGTPASTSKAATKHPKGYRFPTPYKSKKEFRFNNQDKMDKENKAENVQSPQVSAVFTTLEPKEIVLRSIRKRSLSVTIDGDLRKRKALNVTFFSPANQTASIADLDEKLAQSAAKSRTNRNATQYVTQRKRSLSLDEKYLRQQPSKLPRPVPISPLKPRPATRTKLPNFSAIHQQQFEKMENLVDYVQRKTERAQNLTNSALKSRNAAAASPAAKRHKPAASKPLILTSTINKDASNAGKLQVLTPNKNQNLSNIQATTKSDSEKLTKRTQRHMDMFKSRHADPKSANRKNQEIIRGVRSNRRFELMMQHRKTSGN